MNARRAVGPVVAAVLAITVLPGEARAEKRPIVTGYGHFTPGVFAGSFGGVGQDLGRTESLGNGSELGPMGLFIGGGGRGIFGPVVLGGKGFGIFGSSSPGANGDLSLGGGGGGFDLGWALVKTDWLFFPFIGVGGMGVTVDVENTSNQVLRLGTQRTLSPGKTAALESGFFTGEFGFGLQRLLFWGDGKYGRGGFLVGAEVGFLAALTGGDWTYGDADVPGLAPARIKGGYLRLSLGGGGHSVMTDD